MNDSIQQLIHDARAIIANHHDGMGETVVDEGCSIKRRILRHCLDIEDGKADENKWEEYISALPDDMRAVMIALDDCMDCHDTTRYV